MTVTDAGVTVVVTVAVAFSTTGAGVTVTTDDVTRARGVAVVAVVTERRSPGAHCGEGTDVDGSPRR